MNRSSPIGGTLSLRICQVVEATPRSRIVRLDLDGKRFQFAAGQAVLVRLPWHTKPCAYSIAAAPEDVARDGSLELLVGEGSRGGSDRVLHVGTQVDVQGPVGSFTLARASTDDALVFIAGGCGIAPLRSMIREALARGFPTIAVIYSARTPQEFAYADELSALAASGRITWLQKVTRAEEGDAWIGARGRIDRNDLGALMRSTTTHCFLCGPPAMVAAIESQLVSHGLAHDRVHVDGGGPVLMPAPRGVHGCSSIR